MCGVVVGDNFTFGEKAAGTVATMRELGAIEADLLAYDSGRVSRSATRCGRAVPMGS